MFSEKLNAVVLKAINGIFGNIIANQKVIGCKAKNNKYSTKNIYINHP